LGKQKYYATAYSETILVGNLTIMPDSVLSDVGSAYEDLLDAIELLPKAVGPNLTGDGVISYEKKTEAYLCDITRIRFCTSEQFQKGTLRDDAYIACASKYKPTHKADCL
jgi:hypothetical protein